MNTSFYNVEPGRGATKVESRALGLNIVKRGMGFDAGSSKTEVTFAPGGSQMMQKLSLSLGVATCLDARENQLVTRVGRRVFLLAVNTHWHATPNEILCFPADIRFSSGFSSRR